MTASACSGDLERYRVGTGYPTMPWSGPDQKQGCSIVAGRVRSVFLPQEV